MTIRSRRLETLEAKDIEALIGVSEGLELEFKRDLPAKNHRDFLAEVVAFANTAGGDLIIGIEEEDSVASSIVGVGEEEPFAQITRLEQIVASGVAPGIPGLRIQAVASRDWTVLIVRVPRSWAAPHMVTYQSTNRCWKRAVTGIQLMDIYDLRQSILSFEGTRNWALEFRADRIQCIADRKIPFPLAVQPLAVLHIVPFLSRQQLPVLDVATIAKDNRFVVSAGESFGVTFPRYNVDGILKFDWVENQALGYAQVYRTGVIEVASVVAHDESRVFGPNLEQEIRAWIQNYSDLLTDHGAHPPWIVFLSLIGVEGKGLVTPKMAQTHRTWGSAADDHLPPSARKTFDRDPLLLPDVLVDDLEDTPDSLVAPLLGSLWNASNFCERPPG